MSQSDHESHTGPIKTPAQLLWTSFFAFVVPIFVIIGLVFYVTSGNKSAPGADNSELAVAKRIERVGSVKVGEPARTLQSGEAAYKMQCMACHDAGIAGAPKFGDVQAWAARVGNGYEALLNSALKGKNAMPAQAGGALSDLEIGRAVVHMVNASGGQLAEPPAPADMPLDSADAQTPDPAMAEEEAAPAPGAVVAARDGQTVYQQACAACHVAGVAGAPKFGDKAAWAPRVTLGLAGLTNSAIKGKGAMPARGGAAVSDAEIEAAVTYMLAAVK